MGNKLKTHLDQASINQQRLIFFPLIHLSTALHWFIPMGIIINGGIVLSLIPMLFPIIYEHFLISTEITVTRCQIVLMRRVPVTGQRTEHLGLLSSPKPTGLCLVCGADLALCGFIFLEIFYLAVLGLCCSMLDL